MDENIKKFTDSTYEVIGEIGSGGAGVVYKAWHNRLEKYVIIKELKNSSSYSTKIQRNEIEALKNVKSKFLPQIYDFIEEDNCIYTVMEYIEGNSFDKLVTNGEKFEQARVIKWYKQLCEALEVIHKNDICHRDIKPANIMLTPEDNICLIDFNAALVNGNDIKMISRSLGYASPEQYEIFERFQKERQQNTIANNTLNIGIPNTTEKNIHDETTVLDVFNDTETELLTNIINSENTELATEINSVPKTIMPETYSNYSEIKINWKLSDIYSLGATMYQLLTGIRPSMKAEEIKPVSEMGAFSESIATIIDCSMSIKPQDRFLDIKALKWSLDNVIKLDKRWKNAKTRKKVLYISFITVFTVSAFVAFKGKKVMAQEKEELFYSYIYNVENNENYAESYNEAVLLYNDRIEPYCSMSLRLWKNGDIEICKNFIEENLGEITKFSENIETSVYVGDIYYILGNCYYYNKESVDYDTASQYFEIATLNNSENPAYFRDYIISLVRIGEVEKATELLNSDKATILDKASLELLKGEVAYVNKDYESALKSFENATQITEDEDILYTAYYSMADIYISQNQLEIAIDTLKKGISSVNVKQQTMLYDELAEIYVKNNQYKEAIVVYETLKENGQENFNRMYNLAALYSYYDDLESARNLLDEMSEKYPKEYRIPMQQAFVEAKIQEHVANESRDYSDFENYYNKAIALYNEYVLDKKDTEMQQLESVYTQLKSYGWL